MKRGSAACVPPHRATASAGSTGVRQRQCGRIEEPPAQAADAIGYMALPQRMR